MKLGKIEAESAKAETVFDLIALSEKTMFPAKSPIPYKSTTWKITEIVAKKYTNPCHQPCLCDE